MDLTQYVNDLQHQLEVAAEAGGEEASALAERLTGPLESATRLVLLEALSVAASEITRELAPGSVDVRLRGRDPEFVVTSPPASPDFDEASEARPEAAPPSAPGRSSYLRGGTRRRLTSALPTPVPARSARCQLCTTMPSIVKRISFFDLRAPALEILMFTAPIGGRPIA